MLLFLTINVAPIFFDGVVGNQVLVSITFVPICCYIKTPGGQELANQRDLDLEMNKLTSTFGTKVELSPYISEVSSIHLEFLHYSLCLR